MQELCDYQRLGDGRWRCQRCTDETSSPRDRAPLRHCDGKFLGTRIGKWLRSWGMTTERYREMRGKHRVVGGMNCILVEMPDDEPRECGCDGRKAWLNWADKSARLLVNRLW